MFDHTQEHAKIRDDVYKMLGTAEAANQREHDKLFRLL